MSFNPFRFYTLLLESLDEISRLKNIIVRLNQYEFAGKLRDIEKQLQQAASEVYEFSLPLPSPKATYLKSKKYRDIFTYARALNWTDLPDYVAEALKDRKNNLNKEFNLTPNHYKDIITLNESMLIQERELNKLLKIIANSKEENRNTVHLGQIKVECFLEELPIDKVDRTYYQLICSSESYLQTQSRFNENQSILTLLDHQLVEQLPLFFFENDVSVLLLMILQQGYLAWGDLIQVKFTRFKVQTCYLIEPKNL